MAQYAVAAALSCTSNFLPTLAIIDTRQILIDSYFRFPRRQQFTGLCQVVLACKVGGESIVTDSVP
jgi:hypothetical protein